VHCLGRCWVKCVDTGNCNVQCDVGNATTCADGRRACGVTC
jgi:hypothetical protein